jgi:hypothetical protein
MQSGFTDLQKQYRISDLCQTMEATLHPCWEEGFPRHDVHRLPFPVVVECRGQLGADLDPQMAVVFELTRHTVLPILRDTPEISHLSPPESLYLAMEVGSPLLPQRTRLLREASSIFMDLAQEAQKILLVAISHRRLVNRTLIIRHCPVALFEMQGQPLWLHPAGQEYGLIRAPFPERQHQRILGPRKALLRRPETLNQMDDATGLPAFYAYAKQCVRAADEGEEDPVVAAVLDYQAQSLLQMAIVQEAEDALKLSTQQFLRGFESFFGMGGLMPRPGVLDLN